MAREQDAVAAVYGQLYVVQMIRTVADQLRLDLVTPVRCRGFKEAVRLLSGQVDQFHGRHGRPGHELVDRAPLEAAEDLAEGKLLGSGPGRVLGQAQRLVMDHRHVHPGRHGLAHHTDHMVMQGDGIGDPVRDPVGTMPVREQGPPVNAERFTQHRFRVLIQAGVQMPPQPPLVPRDQVVAGASPAIGDGVGAPDVEHQCVRLVAVGAGVGGKGVVRGQDHGLPGGDRRR